jgi:hypothetical protein
MIWYGTFYVHHYTQSSRQKIVFDIEHNLLPTRLHILYICITIFLNMEPSGWKYVEDINNYKLKY